jgi:hypothetical protein
MTKQLLISDLISKHEKDTVVSKYRTAEADNSFVELKNRMADTFVSEFKSRPNTAGFVNTPEKVSKLRAVITDATCETAVCAGVVQLYKECNPNIFDLMPNFTQIPCDGKKTMKFGRKGRYTTFAPSTTLSALTTFTDLTATLDNEILLGCVIKTPKVVEGKYGVKMTDEVCGESAALKLVCFTVDTLSQLEEHLTISIQNEAIKYLKSVTNNVAPATGTLKDIIREVINNSNTPVGAVDSNDKILFVNPTIIQRMAMETYSQGMPVFPSLKLECGSLFCDVFCLDGVAKVVVLPETILPKVTNKYQLLLIKADQFDAGTSASVIAELPNDLSMLLNSMKSLVAGYKPYMLEEISQFAGKTTYSTLIS